jgi:MFS transporter, ACDE family, multidrug resistance protein
MEDAKPYRNINFVLAGASGLMAMMSVSMIVPAFSKIAQHFAVTEQQIGLLMTLSTLPLLILTPVAGVFADRVGRKKLLVPALFLFGISGVACAFAPSYNTLLFLRVFQGICGAPLATVGIAIIGDLFTGHKRAEAMGDFTSIMYAGYVVYPLAGGALALLAWNYTFLPFALSIVLGLLVIVFLHCPEPKDKQSLKQYLGSGLHYMKSWKVVWVFSASVVTYILLYGAFLTYFSLFMAGRFNASSMLIGLDVSILGLATAISSSLVGRLNKKYSVFTLITVSFIIYAGAMVMVPLSPVIWVCLAAALIFGMGHGLNLPSQSIIVAGAAPIENRAGLMAINGTMMSLGMTVGPMIMGLIFSTTSLNATFYIAALIALVIPAIAAIVGKKRLSK